MSSIELHPDTLLNPMPVVMASCKRPGEKPNLITLAWAGIASSKPPTISIAIRPGRYSFDIIQETKEFTIVVPDEKMVESVDFCGCVSGRDADKFQRCGLTPVQGKAVDAPLVEQAPLNLECKCTQIIDLGAHHLFLGEVVAVHLREDCAGDKSKLNNSAFAPIVYSYGANEYLAVGRSLGKHGFAKDKF